MKLKIALVAKTLSDGREVYELEDCVRHVANMGKGSDFKVWLTQDKVILEKMDNTLYKIEYIEIKQFRKFLKTIGTTK